MLGVGRGRFPTGPSAGANLPAGIRAIPTGGSETRPYRSLQGTPKTGIPQPRYSGSNSDFGGSPRSTRATSAAASRRRMRIDVRE